MIRYGLQQHLLQDYLAFEETPNSASWPGAGGVGGPAAGQLYLYAKDKAGVSALYLKDDAGSEREVAPASQITGSGTANRLAYWSSSSVLAANAALTVSQILVADANGLPTGNASAQITNLTGSTALILKGTPNSFVKIDGDATGNPYLEWAQNGTFKARFQYLDADDSLALSVNGAERWRFGAAGQLGIGGATYGTAGNLIQSGGPSAAPSWLDHTTDFLSQYLLASAVGGRAAFLTAWTDLTDGGATALHSHAGGSGHTIRENGTDQNARTGLNFIDTDAGAGLITDDAGNDETEVNLQLFALLSGRSGGQTLIGGTASGNNLTLQSTSHATRGTVVISDLLESATERSFLIGTINSSPIMGTTPPALVEIGGAGMSSGPSVSLYISSHFVGDNNASHGIIIDTLHEPSSSSAGNLITRGMLVYPKADPPTGVTISRHEGIEFGYQTGDDSGAITSGFALYIGGPALGTIKPTNSYGINVDNPGSSGITLAIGLHIGPVSGATNNFCTQIEGELSLTDGISAPATAGGWARVYVDTADGDLKVKFGDGTVRVVSPDTAAPDWTITNPPAADRTIDGGDGATAVRSALMTLIQDLIDQGILS